MFFKPFLVSICFGSSFVLQMCHPKKIFICIHTVRTKMTTNSIPESLKKYNCKSNFTLLIPFGTPRCNCNQRIFRSKCYNSVESIRPGIKTCNCNCNLQKITIVSEIIALLNPQTFFGCNFLVQNCRSNCWTNFCCNFLPCFIQKRSL